MLFGLRQIAAIGGEIPPDESLLIIYGGGIKQTVILRQLRKTLAKRFVIEFDGIEPNPTYGTLMWAVALAR